MVDTLKFMGTLVDNNVVDPFAKAVGQPNDQVRIIVVFLFQYVLGWFIHYCVHGALLRHLFVTVIGALIMIWMYGNGIYQICLMGYGGYFMMKFMPRNGASMGKYVTWFVLALLSYHHIEPMLRNFGGTEFGVNTQTMLLACKISALAWCYEDGGKNEEELSKDQIERKVVELPSLLEITSYIFFCNSAALGIFFEFSDYKRWIERTGEYEKVPSPILPSLKYLLQGLVCLGIFTGLNGYCSVPECWGEAYAALPLWKRIIFFNVAMTGKRFFYYTPFMISNGAMVACGLSYNGLNSQAEHKWDKIVGVYLMGVETADSCMTMLQCWNHQVHLWLKFYVQCRLVSKGGRAGPKESMIVFLTSAFWHGFYPFYYIMFFLAAILSEVTKDIYKSWIFFQVIPKKVRYFIAHLFSMCCMNYLGIIFTSLTFTNGGKFMARTYYCVPIGLFVVLALTRGLNIVGIANKKVKAMEAAKVEKEGKKE